MLKQEVLQENGFLIIELIRDCHLILLQFGYESILPFIGLLQALFLQLFLLDFFALPRPKGLFTGYSTSATHLSTPGGCCGEILLLFRLVRSRFPALGKWFMHLPLIWFCAHFDWSE